MNAKKTFIIDGNNFSTLEGFYEEISHVFVLDDWWGKNLDAFNDVIGGYGTPEEGFIFIWKNSESSKNNLGYEETTKQLKRMMLNCHPSNRKKFGNQLAAAECQEGTTVFDWLIEIIKDHKNVQLILA